MNMTFANVATWKLSQFPYRIARVFIMIDTIEKALHPVSLVSSFLGFEILRYPLNQPRYRLTIFCVLTGWSVYGFALYYVIFQFGVERVFNSLITYFFVIINLFITVIFILITICKHEKYWQYIRKLDLVDNTLEEFGIPKEYDKVRNLARQALIIWFLIFCATWIFDSLLCIIRYNDTRGILVPIVITYLVHVNSIMDITFVLLLRYIGTRLDKINEHIEQLSQIENYGFRCKWEKSLLVNGHYVRNAKNRQHILWIIIHLHLELCRTARDINDFFGIQMTLQMTSCFVLLNILFYYEYYMLLHIKEIFIKNNNREFHIEVFLSSTMWIIVILTKLISLNHICESVSIKAQSTRNNVHKLTNFICFAEVREEIYQFVLQISLRPLKFSGYGLFYFGYGFIRKAFIWIPTTIIFMAQMNVTPEWTSIYKEDNITYNELHDTHMQL